jgi:hypothetical protein
MVMTMIGLVRSKNGKDESQSYDSEMHRLLVVQQELLLLLLLLLLDVVVVVVLL